MPAWSCLTGRTGSADRPPIAPAGDHVPGALNAAEAAIHAAVQTETAEISRFGARCRGLDARFWRSHLVFAGARTGPREPATKPGQ